MFEEYKRRKRERAYARAVVGRPGSEAAVEDQWAFITGVGFEAQVPAVRELRSARRVLASSVGEAGSDVRAAPGWYPDVCKRFELRYWNGAAWTDHVATAGVQAVDPVG